MSVHLSPEIEALLREKVETGHYASADELVRQALQLLEEQDRFLALHRGDLRAQIQEGADSLRRGEGVDGEAVFNRLEAELYRLENPKTS